MAYIKLPPYGSNNKISQSKSGYIKLPPLKQSSTAQIAQTQGAPAVPSKVLANMPGTMQTLAGLQNNPLNTKQGGFFKAIGAAGESVLTAGKEFIGRTEALGRSFLNPQSSRAEFAGKTAEGLVGAANLALSPITAIFHGAEKLPALGSVSKLISLPFSAAGEVAVMGFDKALDKVPESILSKKAKEQVRNGGREITALAAQFAVGGAYARVREVVKPHPLTESIATENPALAEKVKTIPSEKTTELIKNYGAEDAKTIIRTAAEKASPINIKELSLNTKMSDIRDAAIARGFDEYTGVKFKDELAKTEQTKFKSNLAASNVQQVNRQAPQFGGKKSEMWERVSRDIPQAEQEVMQYQGITLKGAVEAAEQITSADSGRAYRIALGLERSPANTTNSMVNRVLAEKAKLEGNIELQAELVKNRTLSQIRRGQEIVSEREIQGGLAKDNVAFNMKQVLDERVKLFEKKTKTPAKQAVSKETGEIKARVKIPSRADWNKFIEEIKC